MKPHTRRLRPGPHVGIRPHNGGYQVFVKVGGRFYSQMFPKTATPAEMQDWRQQMRTTVLATLPEPPAPTVGPRQLTNAQRAMFLALVQEAIHEQATGGASILDGVRRRLFPD